MKVKRKRRRTTRDRRKEAKHSREPLPIGTTRVRWHNRHRVRFIKVAHGGAPHDRWRPFARYLWERHNGPVPAGKRVIHLDGDTLNDSLDNLVAATPGDVAFLAHERDPQMSRDNRAQASFYTAEHNRLRGQINRALNWLPTRWYAVFESDGYAINQPHRSRRQLLQAHGIDAVTLNGILPKGVELPFTPMRGLEIDERFGKTLRKVQPTEACR